MRISPISKIALISLTFFNSAWAAQSTIFAIDLSLDSTEMQKAVTLASSIAQSAESTDFFGLIVADDIVRHVIEPAAPTEFISRLEQTKTQIEQSEKSNFAIGIERGMAMAQDSESAMRIVSIGNGTVNTFDQASDSRFAQWASQILIPDLAVYGIPVILVLTNPNNSVDLVEATTNASSINEVHKLPRDDQSVFALLQVLNDEILLSELSTSTDVTKLENNAGSEHSFTNNINPVETTLTAAAPADVTTQFVETTITAPLLTDSEISTAVASASVESTLPEISTSNKSTQRQIESASSNETTAQADGNIANEKKQTTSQLQPTETEVTNDATSATTRIALAEPAKNLERTEASDSIDATMKSDIQSSLAHKYIIIAIVLIASAGMGLIFLIKKRLHKSKPHQRVNTRRDISVSPLDWNGNSLTDSDDFDRTRALDFKTPNKPKNVGRSKPRSATLYEEDETVLHKQGEVAIERDLASLARNNSPDSLNDTPENIFDRSEYTSVSEDDFDAFERSINAKKGKEPVS